MMRLKKASAARVVRVVAVAAASLWLAGCATTSGNPKDSAEGFNRAMFAFNETVDSAVIKPVATGYDAVLPDPVKTGVGNFFGNLGDLWIGINNLLQGKPATAVSDGMRFAVNTTFGIVGLIDIATPMGLEKHDEDFGQTLGRWGVGDGTYLVWPFIGSRTVRDTAGFVVDFAADPVANIDHVPSRNTLYALRVIETRASLLPADKVVEEAALDKYAYLRDAYLQRRKSLIHDGNPPKEAVSQ
jgi:phospholipid-binding lipoprotein MlaA